LPPAPDPPDPPTVVELKLPPPKAFVIPGNVEFDPAVDDAPPPPTTAVYTVPIDKVVVPVK
jgi:hypothetical protein